MSTLSLYNDSAAHIRVMYVSMCMWVGERMKETVGGREGETVAGVRISNGTRLGTFF